jgi:cysteine desulfurase
MKFWPFFTSKRIYADAAAGTPLSRSAKRELLRLLPLFGNSGSLHSEGVQAKQELENAREKVAKTIGAHADEIVFTSGGTEANNLALFGTLRPLLNERGELNAITSAIEHPSVLEPLRALERDGLYTTELSVNESGHIAAKELREALSEETALVSVQMVNSEMGTVQNIREIAKEIRHARNPRAALGMESKGRPWKSLYLHTDASQAPLWLSINVEKLGIDMLTLDAQKMMGPKGAGALYIKRGTDLEPLLWGGGQEWGLRSGTENVVMAGALATALEEAQTGVKERAQRIELVRDFMFKEIQKRIPEAELNGAIGEGRVANNINISIPGMDAQMAVIALDTEGVAVSTRSACSSDEEPSYVIKALGKSDTKAKSAIRITLLPSATMADAAQIANALAIVAKRYRNVV